MTTKLAIITDPIYLEHDTGAHPECSDRLEAIQAALGADEELQANSEAFKPAAAPDEAILRCHTQDHLDRVMSTSGMSGWFDPDTVFSPNSADAARFAAGGAIMAVDKVLEESFETAFAMVRPPGHHACPERAMGFCLFNNAAIAARHAMSKGMQKVLIIDFDVHHGNGTQDTFYSDPDVFYYSLHLHPHYPGTGAADEKGRGEAEGTNLNRPLPHHFPAGDFVELYSGDLSEIVGSFKPDFAIISAGFDSHLMDPLGGLSLKDPDFWTLTQAVLEIMPTGRVISTLEGGYNLQILGGAVRAHLRALAGLWC